MKRIPIALVTCFVLAACSPQYRNGAVRPTVPETLVGAHAAPAPKPSADKATDAKPAHDPNS
ncbi:MAG: hypothetical protein DYH18_10030 [Xanthomonadales bacterium PRO7]|nr:hypothetical protein [Xanthomonadales bacterium PRO7]HMM56137.1 hypothetical protein [Rudaea sp.]